jgi:FeS assembly SUF system regulator
MFRLSKITDYGIVLLAHLAKHDTTSTHNAREVAQEVDLPLPVVAKVLKSLARRGILQSHRGAKGGYSLARRPQDISVTEMIGALEGPVAMTECALQGQLCPHEDSCAVRDPWQIINRVVQESLSRVTLANLIDSDFSQLFSGDEVVDRGDNSISSSRVHSPRSSLL